MMHRTTWAAVSLLVAAVAVVLTIYVVMPNVDELGMDPDLSRAMAVIVAALGTAIGLTGVSYPSAAKARRGLRSLETAVRSRQRRSPDLEGFALVEPLGRAVHDLIDQLESAGQAVVDRQSLQDVLDSMPDSLVVVDEVGVVQLANRTFAERLRYGRPAEIVGKALAVLTGEAHPLWYAALLESGTLVAADATFKAHSGGVVSMKTSGRRLSDSHGGPGGIVLVGRDDAELTTLTQELLETTERLQDSERFFQNLFDAMDDPITVIAEDYEILQANRQARLTFGRDVVGRRCYQAFRMRDEPCLKCPARMTFAQNRSVSVEHRMFGNAITRISTYPLLSKEGELKAVINHKRDVTKERQLEDLKVSFLMGVSHDLRTPLTSILGFNKLNIRRLQRHVIPAMAAGPEEARTALKKAISDMEIMASEGERLGRLVNDVLDLSKLEAGKLRLNMEDLDLAPLIEAAIIATSALARDKPILVIPDLPHTCPTAWGDRDRLAQVLVNLLSNAIKFTDRGEVRVSVSIQPTELLVGVFDSGVGIAPDELLKIFERFRQVGETQAGRPAGTGLGLPICKELITLHHGRIWAESKHGQGSTFFFTLRRMDALSPLERSADLTPHVTMF